MESFIIFIAKVSPYIFCGFILLVILFKALAQYYTSLGNILAKFLQNF